VDGTGIMSGLGEMVDAIAEGVMKQADKDDGHNEEDEKKAEGTEGRRGITTGKQISRRRKTTETVRRTGEKEEKERRKKGGEDKYG
jgi:hypothetical protein